MFKWLFVNRNKESEAAHELAMRARIATKLRNYNAAEDTTISSFSLAGEAAQRKTEIKATRTGSRDVWGQANPGETGHWKREDRRARDRTNSGGHSAGFR